MKHSDTTPQATRRPWPRAAAVLMFALPVLLIVPNIALNFTEIHYSALERAANVLLPLGIYGLYASWGPKIGPRVLWSIPLMVLCAFQIVLLFLYGEAVIAIDMFLNVATTNVHEATELLRNLTSAILTVLILYLPLIAAGVWATVVKARVPRRAVVIGRRISIAILAAGIIVFGLCFALGDDYRPSRKLFPVNVLCNMAAAAERDAESSAYLTASEGFSYGASCPEGCDADSAGCVVVMVVGETSRCSHWQLAGYSRPTNPRLCSRERDLVFFPKTLSESNTTHKSVPLMLSGTSAETFGDEIYRTKSIVDAFREAGFHTAWLTTQSHNHNVIEHFSNEADTTAYLCDIDGREHLDGELAQVLNHFLCDQCRGGDRVFVVLHTYGSHFNYRDRYPESFRSFTPDDAPDASRPYRRELINAYDNSIAYTDAVLDSVISVLEHSGRPAAMVYAADHGEDIFDDSRGRFLHASPNPTYWQIHVPLAVWLSPVYQAVNPEALTSLRDNSTKNVSSSESIFHTLLDLAKVRTRFFKPSLALTSPSYREPSRRYLNDYNEAVGLDHCGLRTSDFSQLSSRHISIR